MREINFNIPTKWNDLTGKQLLQICKLYPQQLDENLFLVRAALIVTGLKIFYTKKNKPFRSFLKGLKRVVIDTYTFTEICNTQRYLLNKCKLSRQLIPSIKIGSKRLYGPGDRLTNMRFGEWLQVDVYMQSYSSTKEIRYLKLAVAAMYRRKDRRKIRSKEFDGDVREQFNEFTIEKNAKRLKRVKPHYFLAISMFFNGSMQGLREKFPLALGETSGSYRGDLLKDTLALIDSLNENDVTKNKEILRAPLYEVLMRLEATRERINKLNQIKKK